MNKDVTMNLQSVNNVVGLFSYRFVMLGEHGLVLDASDDVVLLSRYAKRFKSTIRVCDLEEGSERTFSGVYPKRRFTINMMTERSYQDLTQYTSML